MQLEICNVKKQYKDKCAVNGVNLLLTPGVWGLLGANGAGKTTLMRMIAGITGTTEGEIRYDGVEIHHGESLPGHFRVSATGIWILSRIFGAGLSGIYGHFKRTSERRGRP